MDINSTFWILEIGEVKYLRHFQNQTSFQRNNLGGVCILLWRSDLASGVGGWVIKTSHSPVPFLFPLRFGSYLSSKGEIDKHAILM